MSLLPNQNGKQSLATSYSAPETQWEGMDHIACLGCLWDQHVG